jgi:uncharacterized protein (DUF924 family)
MASASTSSLEPIADAAGVLSFWLNPANKPFWFKKDEAFDATVRERLGGLYEAARNGQLNHWADTADGLRALVLLLDQVPRNIHRGTPDAFATDAQALAYARTIVERGFDRGLTTDEGLFVYLPFEHSEALEDQDRAVALIAALGDAEYTRYAEAHRDVIRRFGRFPHRNRVLGRASTPSEEAYLAQHPNAFG